MSHRIAIVTCSILLHGCLFAPEEEAAIEPSEQVDVVSEDAPFDPSKAIADTGRGELQESAGEEPPEKTEEVATEVEAENLEEGAEEAVERINESAVEDDQAKAAVASNPPPEDPGSGERWTITLLDWSLEFVLILVLALALSVPCWLVLRFLGAARREGPWIGENGPRREAATRGAGRIGARGAPTGCPSADAGQQGVEERLRVFQRTCCCLGSAGSDR